MRLTDTGIGRTLLGGDAYMDWTNMHKSGLA